MKLHHCLIAAATLAISVCTGHAAPKDWVGKELPTLDVKYMETAPELKGKPAIVEFWATWCPPCRKSIPHLNEINKKFKEKGLVIVGVTNEKEDTVKSFREKTPMEYNVAIDAKGELGSKFGITGIPHAFIVGKDGKIVWEGHPMSMTDEDIEKALK